MSEAIPAEAARQEKMKKAIESLKKSFVAVRTGRASPSLVENILVEYYGSSLPLKQLAGISVPEPRSLVIQPYDKGAVKEVEKAIQKSDLGINPVSEGGVIRLNLPQPTEERRKELVKIVKKNAEDAKVVIRNIRREGMDELKKSKDKISEDQLKLKEAEIQNLTDKYSQEVDKLLKKKEAEIMEV